MSKTLEQKKDIVENIKENLNRQKTSVFLDFSKVDSKAFFKLRDELKAANCSLQVVKKTLLKKALAFLKLPDLYKRIDTIEGQLALAFGFDDEAAPARICKQNQKDNENLKILGGFLGKDYWDKEKMTALANLPSKNELLGRLVGSIKAPINNFVYVLQGNIKGLMNVLSRIKH